jgi:hypothetical protein
VIDSRKIVDSIEKADSILSKLGAAERSMKSAVFNKSNFEFIESQFLLDESFFGEFVRTPLHFEMLDCLKFNERITESINNCLHYFKCENGESALFFIDQNLHLNACFLTVDGAVSKQNRDLLHGKTLVDLKVASAGGKYLFYLDLVEKKASIQFNRSKNLQFGPGCQLLVTDERLNYLCHLGEMVCKNLIAKNESKIIRVNHDHEFHIQDSGFRTSYVSLTNVDIHMGSAPVDVGLSEDHLFVLCTGELMIFDLASFNLVKEIETMATQLKVSSAGLLFLFNSVSRVLSVHQHSGGFKKIKDVDLSVSLPKGMRLAADTTRFVSFYDSRQAMFNFF